MWIMLPDAFVSVVEYVTNPPEPDMLLVRARRAGDLEKLFPGAKIERTVDADYLYRTTISRNTLKLTLMQEVDRIDYKNFKNSVAKEDKPLHDAYLKCWTAMNTMQATLDPAAARQQDMKWYHRDPDPTLDPEWDSAFTSDLPRQPAAVVGKSASKKARKVRKQQWIISGKVTQTDKP